MNKKRTLVTVLFILLVVFVSGVSFLKFKNSSSTQNPVVNNTTDKNNVFTSVKDALSKNITLVCEFKDDSGSLVKSHIKNGAIRVTMLDSDSEKQSSEIIIKDKKMYMWDMKSKQGFVYDVPESEGDESVGMTGSEAIKSEAYIDMIDKYKDSCKVSTVEDSYFELPKDIEFQDMAKFLEDLKSQMPQLELPNQ